VSTTAPRLLLVHRLRPRDLFAVDALLALALVVLCGYAASEQPLVAGTGLREPAWLTVLAGILLGAPIAVRRRWPLPVVGVIFVGTMVTLGSGLVPDYASAAPAVALSCALYSVGLAVPMHRSVTMLAVCLTGTTAALVVAVADFWTELGGIGFTCLLLAGSWLIGRTMRERRAYAAQAAERLTHEAVSEERLRIARELHDIVAHTMSLIAVKAAVANHVAEVSPREAREALTVIEATSRDALRDIRRALGVLRDDASYAPSPGLADLPRLAEQAAIGGVDVDLDVPGGADLPETVALSVFRIVQESLTNVVKHAAPARCRVAVAAGPGEVRVEVTDDGRRAVPPGVRGQGLVGMRERVGMYGGDFAAGPRPEGGFAVHARLPYGPVA
jgi:signal transduction histidine kinase